MRKERVAENIFGLLPITVHNLLESPEWKGGPILQVTDGTDKNPSAKDISDNYPFVKAVVVYSPHKARSVKNLKGW